MESDLETKLIKRTKLHGGMCRKVKAIQFTGWPDRSLYFPGGEHHLIETKYEDKGSLSARQRLVIRQLRRLGVSVWVITTDEELNAFFNLHVKSPAIK